uniref:coiled-coil-helix-coiled-coil-helix domain-containing protein 5 isoform X1 n=1 Tax=Doryrhamphus excisus TaxID=161450 RepID=UPI0025AE5E49|nr:coiled-coil-helix-coiled-coil-helix domain-containing protein 5 isoform X1 [Doryrhamphus excisus]
MLLCSPLAPLYHPPQRRRAGTVKMLFLPAERCRVQPTEPFSRILRPLTATSAYAAFNITARYCHKEMEAYGSCVASNPSTWQETCHELKMKVAQCTSSHPVIQKIREDCSKEFVEFEKCLRENQGTPASCSAHVARFLGCAETVDLNGVGKNPVSVPS